MKYFNSRETALALPYQTLVKHVAEAMIQYGEGAIYCPVRQVLPMGSSGGMLLSMPATAADISIHKLLSHSPMNGMIDLPLIQGVVSVLNSIDGSPIMTLDGPTVTGRR